MDYLEQTIMGLPPLKGIPKSNACIELVQDNVNLRLEFSQIADFVLQYSGLSDTLSKYLKVEDAESFIKNPPNDGRDYARRGNSWVASTISTPTQKSYPVIRHGDKWIRMDRYDLKMQVGDGEGFDLAVAQVFNLDGKEDHDIFFKNTPEEGRAMLVTLIVHGSGGVLTWPANLIWDQSTAPTLGDVVTVLTLVWCGEFWMGNVFSRC